MNLYIYEYARLCVCILQCGLVLMFISMYFLHTCVRFWYFICVNTWVYVFFVYVCLYLLVCVNFKIFLYLCASKSMWEWVRECNCDSVFVLVYIYISMLEAVLIPMMLCLYVFEYLCFWFFGCVYFVLDVTEFVY